MKNIDVIDFYPPYTDQKVADHITEYVNGMLQNEVPAFQVEVGNDRHLAGTLAVRQIIEDAVEQVWDGGVSPDQAYPFRFTHQSLRAPFFVSQQDGITTRIAPHVDKYHVGPAIHKEYLGRPTKVQFGYVSEGTKLPPDEMDYDGPDLSAYIDNVYEGVAKLGRLSIFSEGNEHHGMQKTAHYFERQTDQSFGGRYTRYSMLSLESSFMAKPDDDYDSFVTMRKNASLHLDLWQWALVRKELQEQKSGGAAHEYDQYITLANDHITDHPGTNYRYWMSAGIELIENGHSFAGYAYGVTPIQDAAK